jgi:signal transduction histidine kinase
MARLAWLYEHPAEVATDEVTLTRPEVCILRRYSGPMYDPLRDEVVGRIEVYTDFTEARRLEWARDEFLSTASHELKTPIMTLGGYLELLERQAARPEGLDPEQVTRYVGTAQRELERLRHLSEDMLDVARIEAGRFTLRPKEADLAAIVRETVERFARRPGPRGHDQQAGGRADGQAGSRRIVCHAGEPLPGHYDPLRLGQVFTNLLENALKYSPAGREVVVEARREGDQALLSVRDHGIGVPAVDRDNIFLPFYRARNASHGSSEGLGLGLYISRGIVEGHGGRLWVEPAQGGGSLFRVALPLGERSREATLGKSAEPRDLPQPEDVKRET